MKIPRNILFLALIFSCLALGTKSAQSQEISALAEGGVLETNADNRTIEERGIVFEDEGEGFLIDAVDFSRRENSTFTGGWWQAGSENNIFMEGPSEGLPAENKPLEPYQNYMVAVGESIGNIEPLSPDYHGPFLDYAIRITTPGRYLLKLKWAGKDPATDSLYAYFLKPDGSVLTKDTPGFFLFHGIQSDMRWDFRGAKDNRNAGEASRRDAAEWVFDQPGIYALRLAMREQGAALAAIALNPVSDQEPQYDVEDENFDPACNVQGCRNCQSDASLLLGEDGAGSE